jgi:hypothetical protein
MMVLVSMTSFTGTPVRPGSFFLYLDFLWSHRYAWLTADAIQDRVKCATGLAAAQFGRQQVTQAFGLQ